MNELSYTRAASSCFSLACFAVAILSGLVADRAADKVLMDALLAMTGGYIVGSLAAMALGRVFKDSVAAYKAANPVPTLPDPLEHGPLGGDPSTGSAAVS